jgi:hypothetical protein
MEVVTGKSFIDVDAASRFVFAGCGLVDGGNTIPIGMSWWEMV